MNKTIFRLNNKISTIILTSLGICLVFLSNTFYINGFIGYVLYIFRSVLFIGAFAVLAIIEKHQEFKETIKREMGYICLCEILNVVFALFTITHLLSGFFLTLSASVCLITISVLIIEIVSLYTDKEVLQKMLRILDKISSIFYAPIMKLFNNKSKPQS